MPNVGTVNFTWSAALEAAMLGAMSARPAAALLVTPTVVLITDGNPISPHDAVSNHTVANFSGYAADTITVAGPGNIGQSGIAGIAHALFLATTATPFVANNVTGYLVTDGAVAFYGGELFQNPVPIGAAGDFIDLEVLLPLGFYQPAA